MVYKLLECGPILGNLRRDANAVIQQIRGRLQAVGEESLALVIEPMVIEVLVPDYVRRQLQGRVEETITLHTSFDIEANQMAGRMKPRLIGFLSPLDREFFEIFCSVDGVGVRKALRAMVRPVRELACIIQEKDVETLATFPGIGESTAERIVAKLRRKVSKFALMGVPEGTEPAPAHEGNGQPPNAEPDVIRETFEALVSVGHAETEARQMLDRVLSGKKRFKSTDEMLMAIYQQVGRP